MKESDTILSLFLCLYKHCVINKSCYYRKKNTIGHSLLYKLFSLYLYTHYLSLCKLELSLICMAANPSSRGIVSLGKRVVNEIRARDSTQFSALTLRRAAHASVYDKNPDEQIQPSIVPDNVIPPQSDKYWAPHPQTGVFGPAAEHSHTAGGEGGSSPVDIGEGASVLEQKAWFRPTSIEDLEKPHLP